MASWRRRNKAIRRRSVSIRIRHKNIGIAIACELPINIPGTILLLGGRTRSLDIFKSKLLEINMEMLVICLSVIALSKEDTRN